MGKVYRGTEGKKEGEGWRVVFWNVAELANKDKEFWESLKNWSAMALSKTWVEEKGWEKVRKELPGEGGGGFIWGCQTATKKHAKGRGEGDMLTKIKKELMKQGTEMEV